MSRPSFYVVTTFPFWFLLQPCFLCCQIFYRYPESLSRQSLVATYPDSLLQLRSYVATWLLGVVIVCCRDQVFMSRQEFSVFSLSLCRNPVCYVATKLFLFVLQSLSQHKKVCRDLVSLLQPEILSFSVTTYITLS